MTGATDTDAASAFPIEEIRAAFPILQRTVRDHPLVYLDNASTTHKPLPVLEAVQDVYRRHNSNVHRGVHTLSQEATRLFEGARATVRQFLNASGTHEAVFTRGTTEAINLVARSWGRQHIGQGDEVLVTGMEHHSNIVPWQMLCRERGASLRVLPVDEDGDLVLDELEKRLGDRTRLVALVHVSNALGTVNDVAEVARAAHERGIPVLVDGAQALSHTRVDLAELGAEFYVFSGHKLFGPTGIGALVADKAILRGMPPWQGGGDMIKSVTFEETIYNDAPWRFEAGTPNIAGAVGMAAALDWIEEVGIESIAAWEAELVRKAESGLGELEDVRVLGRPERRAGVLSFVMEGIHPHDIGTILDMQGVAIRTGHHCAEPLMRRFGVPGTARVSFAPYNTPEEIGVFLEGLGRVREVFG